jgi:hypothetical protein
MAQTGRAGGDPEKPKAKIVAIIFGIVLLLAGSVGLFWNEWRSASRTATLLAGERSVVSLDVQSMPTPLPAGLVHLAGQAQPSEAIVDDVFPVRSEGLRLDRTVEMYQWREHREGSGDDREYRYEQVWAEGRIPSERFRAGGSRVNPAPPTIASERRYPTEVSIGAFGVAPTLLVHLPASEAVVVTGAGDVYVGGELYRATGAAFSTSRQPSPEIGDVRVRFEAVPAGPISVLGGINGSTVGRWTAPNGQSIAMASPGTTTADAMLAAAYRSNALSTWGIRLAATLVVFVGLALLLPRLDRHIPRIRALRADLEAALVLPLGVVLAAAWASLVIAAAWIVFRPLMSLALIVASITLLLLFIWAGERRARSRGAGSMSEPR